ncbi:MAG: UPF0104 family protein [Nitrospinota bacterium]|nr:MAG: UPF0104 family protein [Nitrospinota bacterium]
MRWRWMLGVILSAGVLFLLVRQLDINQLLTILWTADYRYLLPLVGLIALGECWSALKWQQILSPLKRIAFRRLYTAFMIGHLAHVLPVLRISPFIRAYVVGKKEGMPMSTLLATIVVDRLIDGLTFLGFLALVLLLLDFPPHMVRVEQLLRGGGGVVLLLYLALIGVLVGLRFRAERTLAFFRTLFTLLPGHLCERLMALSATFIAGITLPRGKIRWTAIVGYAVLHKLFAASHLYIIGLAYGITLSPLAYLFFMVFLGSLTRIAGSLGIVGSFEAGTVLALGWYGVPAETALSMALVVRIASLGTVVLLGVPSYWIEELGWSEMRTEMTGHLAATSIDETAVEGN